MSRKVSNWWYLVPLFFGFIGGIIAYFAIRKRDAGKAVNMMVVGIIITVLILLVDIGVIFAPIFL